MSSDDWIHITKTCLYNFDPFKPHLYIVKQGFTGIYIIFLILLKNIDCGYSLEPPHRGGSNEYPQSMFWAEICKISNFYLKIIGFWFWNFQYIGIGVFSWCVVDLRSIFTREAPCASSGLFPAHEAPSEKGLLWKEIICVGANSVFSECSSFQETKQFGSSYLPWTCISSSETPVMHFRVPRRYFLFSYRGFQLFLSYTILNFHHENMPI